MLTNFEINQPTKGNLSMEEKEKKINYILESMDQAELTTILKPHKWTMNNKILDAVVS